MEKKKKTKILIINEGCDDETRTFMEVTSNQLKFLIKVANTNNDNSHSGCEPKIMIFDTWDYVKSEYDTGTSERVDTYVRYDCNKSLTKWRGYE